MPLYFATRPDGYNFFADGIAREGATLTAIAPDPPFTGRGFVIADAPGEALCASGTSWPCALWEVTADIKGVEKRRYYPKGKKHLYEVFRLTVVRALDPHLALGPSAEQLVQLFSILENLHVSDLHVTPSTDDDFAEADPVAYEADADTPAYTTYTRASKLIDQLGRVGAREQAYSVAKDLGDRAVSRLWKLEYESSRSSDTHPYQHLKRHMDNALFYAVGALVVADELSETDFELLVEDFRRLTGQTLAP